MLSLTCSLRITEAKEIEMERSVEPREFHLPLELQFSMRKARNMCPGNDMGTATCRPIEPVPPKINGVVRNQVPHGR